jgi:phytoene dehydrogenase-like protein
VNRVDAVVVGAGMGGLGAALALAEAGRDVVVCEALTYPGGCAATFGRRGHRFEAGATLSAGLDPAQPLRRWLGRHGVTIDVALLDPSLELRAPGLRLQVGRDRAAFVGALCALPDAPVDALRRFFADQERVAATLWALFDDPELLPPLTLPTALTHAARLPRYARLVPLLGRSLGAVVASYGLGAFAPLRTWLDAICQITVQCPADEAEAPFALAAIDYFFHGVGHVRGGLGALADGFVTAITRAGGRVRFADRVTTLRREADGWRIDARSDALHAPVVVANLTPQALAAVADLPTRATAPAAARVASGWSAAMLYLALDPACPLPKAALHVEIVQEPGAPLAHGNHLLVSVAEADDARRAPDGRRVATVSTHVDPARYAEDPAGLTAEVHERMRAGLHAHLPEVADHVALEMTASPRTFQRFTRRPGGLVGGVPRRVGLAQYLDLWPRPVAPGLYLVGDSVLLGQSVLATAIGGQRTARAALAGPLRAARGRADAASPTDEAAPAARG